MCTAPARAPSAASLEDEFEFSSDDGAAAAAMRTTRMMRVQRQSQRNAHGQSLIHLKTRHKTHRHSQKHMKATR